MQTGSQVRSKTYPEKRPGTVIDVQSFAGRYYVEVFFEKTQEKIMLLFCCRTS
ncbi:MAG: hypothetical protein AB1420_04615 [Bacillota bacterium]